MMKRPSFRFFPGYWMGNLALRSCSVGARGLWMDMLCLMPQSNRIGYLQHPNGEPYTDAQLARMVGHSIEEVSPLLHELEASGIFSRTSEGVIFSLATNALHRRGGTGA